MKRVTITEEKPIELFLAFRAANEQLHTVERELIQIDAQKAALEVKHDMLLNERARLRAAQDEFDCKLGEYFRSLEEKKS